ncbi:MAG: hypothetical protein ACMXYG_04905 [Candidatus Woesearchaeota archaeon]
MDREDINKIKGRFLKDRLKDFKDYADVDEDSDIPVTERKVKEKKSIE